MTDEELARKLSTWGQDCKKASMMASGDILVSAADRLEKLAAVLEAAEPAGTSWDNPDTCGVCHLHFAECEADRAIDADDFEGGRRDKDYPACAGARIRIAIRAARST